MIENSLLHLQFEFSRASPSYFRIAREAHLLLYRSMIEALKGSANLAITGRPSRERQYQYQMGDKPWHEIHKAAIQGCTSAWRFSDPQPCDAPQIDPSARRAEPDEYLIGFYDALAMIQTECFMDQFTHSKVVPVSDEDMRTLEWLHERIRNEYEHFIPKYYSAPVTDLVAAAGLSLRLAGQLLFQSGNPLFHSTPRAQLEELFDQVGRHL